MTPSDRYFEFLDKRIAQFGLNETLLYIKVMNVSIKMIFIGIEPTDIMRMNLSYLSVEESEVTDEIVYIWEDSLSELVPNADMIPVDKLEMVYHQTNDYRLLFPVTVKRQASRNNLKHVTYVTFEHGHVFPENYITKPFLNEIQWLCADNYLLVHGALVGYKGHGTLITAPSGKGKSTLALAGLLIGMDYIAEDYTLITRDGEFKGYPLFTTGYLTKNTLDKLPDLNKEILFYSESRNKYLVDLASFRDSFSSEMKIDFLLYPIIGNYDEPEIVPSKSPSYFMQAVKATAQQVRVEPFADALIILFQRLKNLKSYEIHLTTDSIKNALFLKNFIINSCTNIEE